MYPCGLTTTMHVKCQFTCRSIDHKIFRYNKVIELKDSTSFETLELSHAPVLNFNQAGVGQSSIAQLVQVCA